MYQQMKNTYLTVYWWFP